MSVKAMSWVFEHSAAKGGARLVLLALADRAGADGGDCYPSLATLCHRTLMTRRGVQKALEKLEEIGEIEVDPGGGKHGTHRYRLTLRGEQGSPPTGERRSHQEANKVHPQQANDVRRGRSKFAGGERSDAEGRTTFAQSIQNPGFNSLRHPTSDDDDLKLIIDAIGAERVTRRLATGWRPKTDGVAYGCQIAADLRQNRLGEIRSFLADDPSLTAAQLADRLWPAASVVNGAAGIPCPTQPFADPSCPRCDGSGWVETGIDGVIRCRCEAPEPVTNGAPFTLEPFGAAS